MFLVSKQSLWHKGLLERALCVTSPFKYYLFSEGTALLATKLVIIHLIKKRCTLFCIIIKEENQYKMFKWKSVVGILLFIFFHLMRVYPPWIFIWKSEFQVKQAEIMNGTSLRIVIPKAQLLEMLIPITNTKMSRSWGSINIPSISLVPCQSICVLHKQQKSYTADLYNTSFQIPSPLLASN